MQDASGRTLLMIRNRRKLSFCLDTRSSCLGRSLSTHKDNVVAHIFTFWPQHWLTLWSVDSSGSIIRAWLLLFPLPPHPFICSALLTIHINTTSTIFSISSTHQSYHLLVSIWLVLDFVPTHPHSSFCTPPQAQAGILAFSFAPILLVCDCSYVFDS